MSGQYSMCYSKLDTWCSLKGRQRLEFILALFAQSRMIDSELKVFLRISATLRIQLLQSFQSTSHQLHWELAPAPSELNTFVSSQTAIQSHCSTFLNFPFFTGLQLSSYFLNFLHISSIFFTFPQFSSHFLNFLHISSTFFIYPWPHYICRPSVMDHLPSVHALTWHNNISNWV